MGALKVDDTERLEQEVIAAVVSRKHSFSVIREKYGVSAEGKFYLRDSEGPFDSFDVRIFFPADFPLGEPKVWEVGKRIPETPNRHNSNGACICVWEQWLAETTDRSVEAYIDCPLSRYFVSQSVFEQTGEWPLDEEPHFREGLVAAYSRTLGIPPEEDSVRRYLRALARGRLKGHFSCPCDSGRPLRHCHGEELRRLQTRIEPLLAKQMLRRLSD